MKTVTLKVDVRAMVIDQLRIMADEYRGVAQALDDSATKLELERSAEGSAEGSD